MSVKPFNRSEFFPSIAKDYVRGHSSIQRFNSQSGEVVGFYKYTTSSRLGDVLSVGGGKTFFDQFPDVTLNIIITNPRKATDYTKGILRKSPTGFEVVIDNKVVQPKIEHFFVPADQAEAIALTKRLNAQESLPEGFDAYKKELIDKVRKQFPKVAEFFDEKKNFIFPKPK